MSKYACDRRSKEDAAKMLAILAPAANKSRVWLRGGR
jgi:hypothetical protein